MTTGSVDGGAGPTLSSLTVLTWTARLRAPKYTNFETLRASGGTVDLDNIAGITTVELSGGNVSNLSAAQAGAVKVLASGTYTVGVKGAATPGQADVVSLTVDDGLTAKNTITLTAPTLQAVEELNVNAVDNVVITALTNATSLTKIGLSVQVISRSRWELSTLEPTPRSTLRVPLVQ